MLAMVSVSVTSLSGKTITVQVEATDTIRSIKAKIEEKTNIPWIEQMLMMGTEILKNNMSVSDYNILKESTMTVVWLNFGKHINLDMFFGFGTAPHRVYLVGELMPSQLIVELVAYDVGMADLSINDFGTAEFELADITSLSDMAGEDIYENCECYLCCHAVDVCKCGEMYRTLEGEFDECPACRDSVKEEPQEPENPEEPQEPENPEEPQEPENPEQQEHSKIRKQTNPTIQKQTRSSP